MAVSNEIFRAQLTTEADFKTTIGDLERLQQAANDAVNSLRQLDSIKVDVDTKGIGQIVKTL